MVLLGMFWFARIGKSSSYTIVTCFCFHTLLLLPLLITLNLQASWSSQEINNRYGCSIRNGISALKEYCAFWFQMWQLACQLERSFMTHLQGNVDDVTCFGEKITPLNIMYWLQMFPNLSWLLRLVILDYQKSSEIPWYLVVYVEPYHGWLQSC